MVGLRGLAVLATLAFIAYGRQGTRGGAQAALGVAAALGAPGRLRPAAEPSLRVPQ
jgi:hypothetical protein